MTHNSAHRVYLLRHATTEWSCTGRHTSHTDIPLTATGEQLARRAGQTLAALTLVSPKVFASPLRRAQRTAELAGFSDVDTEPLLHEWDYGDYEGLTTTRIRADVPGWTVWTHPCPNGESAEDVTKRAERLRARTYDELAHGDVVLVGHGHFSRSFIASWLGLPVTFGVHFALEPAGIGVLGHERDTPQLQRIEPGPLAG